MYSWLWAKLPGSLLVKLLIVAGLVTVFIVFCYYIFFPWLDSTVFIENENNLQ